MVALQAQFVGAPSNKHEYILVVKVRSVGRNTLADIAHHAPTEVGKGYSLRTSAMQESICSRSEGARQNIAKCAHKLSTRRYRLFGIISCSSLQSSGGKNMSSEKAITCVFALILPRAALRSPPVFALTSPWRHFHPIQMRLLGSMGRKYASQKRCTKSSKDEKPESRQACFA